ncbi:hypothetical protein K9M74_04770 [Candidatus Woesearchaeota archaeon]|nr:hypothetical protein [Candidatus Woesearchaeota archaeon]
MKFNRTGQAALEFLTTYGWAFLVILVMIGALAGFGILTPSNFLPNRCNFASELSCYEHKLTNNGASGELYATVILLNSIGSTLNISDITMTSQYGDLDCSAAGTGQVSAGDTIELICDDNGNIFPDAGEKIKIQARVTYTPLGKKLSQTVDGEIFSSIQES